MDGREENKDPIAEKNGFLLIIMKNKQNQPRRGKTNWEAGKAGQDTRLTTTNQHWNCKHKEILKGANEEGNEGEQLGKINQTGNKMGGVKTN